MIPLDHELIEIQQIEPIISDASNTSVNFSLTPYQQFFFVNEPVTFSFDAEPLFHPIDFAGKY